MSGVQNTTGIPESSNPANPESPVIKRRRGRPVGSRNKAKRFHSGGTQAARVRLLTKLKRANTKAAEVLARKIARLDQRAAAHKRLLAAKHAKRVKRAAKAANKAAKRVDREAAKLARQEALRASRKSESVAVRLRRQAKIARRASEQKAILKQLERTRRLAEQAARKLEQHEKALDGTRRRLETCPYCENRVTQRLSDEHLYACRMKRVRELGWGNGHPSLRIGISADTEYHRKYRATRARGVRGPYEKSEAVHAEIQPTQVSVASCVPVQNASGKPAARFAPRFPGDWG